MTAAEIAFQSYRLADLRAYKRDDTTHLIGDGWVRLGAGTLLTGGAGMGKSVLAAQIAVCVANGCLILGCIKVAHPARVLVVQAENDVETMQRDFVSVTDTIGADEKRVQENLRVIHAFGLEGARLEKFLRREMEQDRPALLIMDNYQSYVGGDLNNSETFLTWRGHVEPLVRQFNCALLLLAHPPKPKSHDDWHVRESVYMAAGHSALANWARCSAELTPAGAGDGSFRLRFGKNAERVGLVDDDGRMVRDLFIKHSGNREKPFWKLCDDQTAPSSSEYAEKVIALALEHPSMAYREIAKKLNCSKSTVERYYPVREP